LHLGNGIENLPVVIGSLRRLRELDLNGNKLTSLPEELCDGCTELRGLYANGNRLTTLPDNLSQLSKLRLLDLGYNGSLEVPASIGTLVNLRHLNLGYNKLRTLPDELANCTSLRELELLGNELTEMPACVRALRELGSVEIAFSPTKRRNQSRRKEGPCTTGACTACLADCKQGSRCACCKDLEAQQQKGGQGARRAL